MRRLAYKSSLAAVTPRELARVGYAGYIQTTEETKYHAVIDGRRYEYFDEPEAWAPSRVMNQWLQVTAGKPRLVVWASPDMAKRKGYWREFDLMGLETYPSSPLTRSQAQALYSTIRSFRQQTSRPLVGVIRTFAERPDDFPSPAFIREQEAIWHQAAGSRLYAIAHFIWEAPEQPQYKVLKDHPECWPDKL